MAKTQTTYLGLFKYSAGGDLSLTRADKNTEADALEANAVNVSDRLDALETSAGVPNDASVTNAKVAASAGIVESKLSLASDAAAGTPSRRSLGFTSTTAAPGDLGLTGHPTGSIVRQTGFGRTVLDHPATAGRVLLTNASDLTWDNTIMRVVNHGSVAGTARPTGALFVYWYGTVQPTSMVAGDIWNDGTP